MRELRVCVKSERIVANGNWKLCEWREREDVSGARGKWERARGQFSIRICSEERESLPSAESLGRVGVELLKIRSP